MINHRKHSICLRKRHILQPSANMLGLNLVHTYCISVLLVRVNLAKYGTFLNVIDKTHKKNHNQIVE